MRASTKNFSLFASGAAYGLLMRIAFGVLPFLNDAGNNGAGGAMLAAFVLLVPFALGAYTVYTAPRKPPTLVFVLFGPWMPTALFVAGTAVLLMEGSICIAMATPIFCIAASLGGCAGWVLTKVTKVGPVSVHAAMLLPLLGGFAETHVPLPQQVFLSEASTTIAAPPEAVWRLINHATDIRPAEMQGGLAYRIGVPYPLEAITAENAQGRVRKLRWAGNVSFDEPITAWEENRFIRWTYSFRPDSFPPGTLDEHVLIGGRYFDLVDTSYRLVPQAGGTRLDIAIHYRVSTHFNWYAARLGRLLVDDSAAAILHFYKSRGERHAPGTDTAAGTFPPALQRPRG